MLDNESPDELQVLIIEDNDDDVVLVKRVLSQSTVLCRLHVARDGQEALDFLFNRCKLGDAPWPDLVLLDLRLPMLEGHEILSRIRGDPELSSVPVYILTGSKREQDLDRSLELGADGFFPKPFALEDVKCVLAIVMKRWARQKRGAAQLTEVGDR
jgi:CheY-like chemotaxis protein